jgi:hypothetical protein
MQVRAQDCQMKLMLALIPQEMELNEVLIVDMANIQPELKR